jgi:hypothetical protein
VTQITPQPAFHLCFHRAAIPDRPIGLTRTGPVNIGENALVPSFRVID